MYKAGKVIIVISGLLSMVVAFHFTLMIYDNAYFYTTLRQTIFKGRLGPAIDDLSTYKSNTIVGINAVVFNPTSSPKELSEADLKIHSDYKSTAFLVIKNKKVVYENYWLGTDKNTVSNSFSMSKTMVSSLVGVALQQGFINSVNQTVGDFLPDYCNGNFGTITIKQLLQMSSGINFDESYLNPFAFPAKAYYGKNLETLLCDYKLTSAPGVYYEYQGGATQLLAFVLEKASGLTLSDLLQQYIWKPTKASDAFWVLDFEGGSEKASCCVYATARDFAKFGQLYLDSGRIDSTQIIPIWYLKESITATGLIDKKDNAVVDFYGYQWWLTNHKGFDVYFARGILGQYIFCVPEKDLVVVRLGHVRSKEKTKKHPKDVYNWLDMALKLAE